MSLVLALLVDAIWGEPGWLYHRLPHPVTLIGKGVSWLEARLLDTESTPTRQVISGAVLAILLIAVAVAFGVLLQWALHEIVFGWAVMGLLMSALMAQKSLTQHVQSVAQGLDTDLDSGREAVAHIVGRDPKTLDEAGVARAAVESLAENFADGVVAPVFWAALLGLPGLIAYKTINTLDSMVGYRSAKYLFFGCVSARLDDLANLLPARLSAVIIALAAGHPRAIVQALRTALHQASQHRSPNAGWPEAAMAGALGVQLAGPRRYGETVVNDPFIGIGSPDLSSANIRKALKLAWRAWLILLLALVALALT